MPSFKECVSKAVKRKAITKKLANQILSAPDPEKAIDDILADASRVRKETALGVVRTAKAIEDVNSHPDGMYAGLQALMAKDPREKAGFANVDLLTSYYQNKYRAKMSSFFVRFEPKRLGFAQDHESLTKFVRAIYGETTDDKEINDFAREWLELTEEMRQDFNSKGGSISKNERFLMPQHHEARRIQKAGYEEWKTYISPRLDRSQMLDDFGNPLSDEQLEESLQYVYESIISHGLNKVEDYTVPRLGRKLSRKHSARRFLYFKDAQSWIDYQNKFGRGDVMSVFTDYIDSMAMDIGVMERLGPNPRNTFDAVKADIKRKGRLTQRQDMFSNAMFDTVTGRLNRGELTTAADFIQGGKDIVTASTLGSAILSALSDSAFMAVTTAYNKIPFMKVIRRQMNSFDKGSKSDQTKALRISLIFDNMIVRANAANRFSETSGVGITGKLAEGVMRFSGLAPWTAMMRKGFTMEFSASLADDFGKTIDELNDSRRRAFKTYGITEKDWNTFRKSQTIDYRGAKFADMMQPGGKKFHQMIMSEVDYAVPVPDARTRAITTLGLGRGTVEGQAWRAAMMLKSFPITIAATHFYRAGMQSTVGEKLQYGATLLAVTSTLGALSLQLKDIARGRDPRPMDDPKFLGAAIIQGGGLSIWGDFLFSDANRFGGGLAATAFGPTGDLVDRTYRLTLGNLQEALSGEQTHVLGELAQTVERYTPKTWQTQLFLGALFDQVEALADPSAEKRFDRIINARERDYGQEHWWEPGDFLPERAPDLESANIPIMQRE